MLCKCVRDLFFLCFLISFADPEFFLNVFWIRLHIGIKKNLYDILIQTLLYADQDPGIRTSD
jgi:hypothetical protein